MYDTDIWLISIPFVIFALFSLSLLRIDIRCHTASSLFLSPMWSVPWVFIAEILKFFVAPTLVRRSQQLIPHLFVVYIA